MHRFKAIGLYVGVYVVTAILSVPISLYGVFLVEVILAPCRGWDCWAHGVIATIIGPIFGVFVIPPIVCIFVWHFRSQNRNYAKKKRS